MSSNIGGNIFVDITVPIGQKQGGAESAPPVSFIWFQFSEPVRIRVKSQSAKPKGESVRQLGLNARSEGLQARSEGFSARFEVFPARSEGKWLCLASCSNLLCWCLTCTQSTTDNLQYPKTLYCPQKTPLWPTWILNLVFDWLVIRLVTLGWLL